jgi:hypothetical protein
LRSDSHYSKKPDAILPSSVCPSREPGLSRGHKLHSEHQVDSEEHILAPPLDCVS